MKARTVLLTLLALAAGGAVAMDTPTPGAPHDALNAMGPQSAHILDLWRVFIWTCSIG